jgi:ectoine hydroxylase-related dioxygenase (phytanoyl-CoA dioxygenase family)
MFIHDRVRMADASLSTSYELTTKQIQEYRSNGYVLLRNVLQPRVLQPYAAHIRDTVDRVNKANDSQGRVSDYSSMFTQVTNVWRLNDEVKDFVLARRFARLASELMNVPGVRLYHDQALIKEPGGKATPWHQDQYYWPLNTRHTITMWMPLVNVTPEMGSMSFVPGSHENTSFERMSISESSQSYFEKSIADSGVDTPSFSLMAGDATFHAGWTLHAAHANKSSSRREVMTIIYYADGTTLLAPENEHQVADRDVFLPGIEPGDPARTELNPLLYTCEE